MSIKFLQNNIFTKRLNNKCLLGTRKIISTRIFLNNKFKTIGNSLLRTNKDLLKIKSNGWLLKNYKSSSNKKPKYIRRPI